MLNNMKIGVRLGLGFGLILVLMVILGVVGLNGMGKINKGLERILKINYSKINLANNTNAKIGTLIETIELMLLKDQAGRVVAKQEIDKLRLEYREMMERLEQLETTDKGKELITAAKVSLANASKANNEVIELSLSGKMNEALQLFNREAYPLDLKIKDAFMGIVQYQEERMDFRYAEAINQFSNSKIVCLVIIAVSLLIGILISLFITRSITHPLSEGVVVSNALAIGGELMGFIVDSVSEVIRISGTEIQPSPSVAGGGIDQDCIAGVINMSERLLVLLDLDRMFSQEEKEFFS